MNKMTKWILDTTRALVLIMAFCGVTAEAQEATTDIKEVSAPLASRIGVANEATYRLDGIVADETTQGIVISNQKKTIRR